MFSFLHLPSSDFIAIIFLIHAREAVLLSRWRHKRLSVGGGGALMQTAYGSMYTCSHQTRLVAQYRWRWGPKDSLRKHWLHSQHILDTSPWKLQELQNGISNSFQLSYAFREWQQEHIHPCDEECDWPANEAEDDEPK